MGILNWFKGKKEQNYAFSEEDRETSVELRKEQAELRKLRNEVKVLSLRQEVEEKRAELEDLRDELMPEEEDEEEQGNALGMLSGNPDQLFMSLLQNVLSKQPTAPQQPQQYVSANVTKDISTDTELTDTEIKDIIKSIPNKQLSLFKTLSRDIQIKLIKSKMPGVSEKTILRALDLI